MGGAGIFTLWGRPSTCGMSAFELLDGPDGLGPNDNDPFDIWMLATQAFKSVIAELSCGTGLMPLLPEHH